MKPRWVSCDGYPCLNSDYERGSDCNLGYFSDYVRLVGKDEGETISNDCELDFIMFGTNQTFFPKEIRSAYGKVASSRWHIWNRKIDESDQPKTTNNQK